MTPRIECKHPSCHCSFESKPAMLQHFRDRHHLESSSSLSHGGHRHRVECRHPSCHRSFESEDSMLQHHRDSHLMQAGHVDHINLHNPTHINTTNGQHSASAPINGLTELILYLYLAQQLKKLLLTIASHGAGNDQLVNSSTIDGVACNDCGKVFRSCDALHQHQWDSANHTRVSSSRSVLLVHGSCVRACSQCGANFNSADDMEQHFMDRHPISEVPKSGEKGTWQHVAERFLSAWKKCTIGVLKVNRIFKVYNTGRRRKSFEQYRKELRKEMANQKSIKEENLELRNQVLDDGNEVRGYHGTTVKCRLGQDPTLYTSGAIDMNASLCTSADRSLCRILQTGFQKSKCRSERFQRFGKGIYTSSISSKASAYVNCSDDDGKENFCKVMIACKVLAGRPYHSTCNSPHLLGPPPGFHSVQGDPGVHLNYDELVVYNDHAILPDFIILYSNSD